MEKHLEAKLRKEVRKLGGYAFKWVSPNVNGVPDRIVLLPGRRAYLVEMKFNGNDLSPQQRKIKQLLQPLEWEVWKISNEQELADFLEFISL